jgi:hypothetical protein
MRKTFYVTYHQDTIPNISQTQKIIVVADDMNIAIEKCVKSNTCKLKDILEITTCPLMILF